MVKIEIATDNDAFGETDDERGAEVARILRALADRFAREADPRAVPTILRDTNGNRVGTCEWKD